MISGAFPGGLLAQALSNTTKDDRPRARRVPLLTRITGRRRVLRSVQHLLTLLLRHGSFIDALAGSQLAESDQVLNVAGDLFSQGLTGLEGSHGGSGGNNMVSAHPLTFCPPGKRSEQRRRQADGPATKAKQQGLILIILLGHSSTTTQILRKHRLDVSDELGSRDKSGHFEVQAH